MQMVSPSRTEKGEKRNILKGTGNTVTCLCLVSDQKGSARCPRTIPKRGNLFLPVCLLVWADGRGTVVQANSAARAKLQGAPKQKLLKLKKITKVLLGQAQGDAYLLF
jgi:hypothetical protein